MKVSQMNAMMEGARAVEAHLGRPLLGGDPLGGLGAYLRSLPPEQLERMTAPRLIWLASENSAVSVFRPAEYRLHCQPWKRIPPWR